LALASPAPSGFCWASRSTHRQAATPIGQFLNFEPSPAKPELILTPTAMFNVTIPKWRLCHSSFGAGYIEFAVEMTKTVGDRELMVASTYSRYSAFISLQRRLGAKAPSARLPPKQSLHRLAGRWKSAGFLSARREALEQWLRSALNADPESTKLVYDFATATVL
jgi:hypothetical protein